MKDEWLDADCAIKHLYNKKIISMCDWQRQHPSDQSYSVQFDRYRDDSNYHVGVITLFIIKRSGKYYTTRSGIRALSGIYHFDGSDIFSQCAIEF